MGETLLPRLEDLHEKQKLQSGKLWLCVVENQSFLQSLFWAVGLRGEKLQKVFSDTNDSAETVDVDYTSTIGVEKLKYHLKCDLEKDVQKWKTLPSSDKAWIAIFGWLSRFLNSNITCYHVAKRDFYNNYTMQNESLYHYTLHSEVKGAATITIALIHENGNICQFGSVVGWKVTGDREALHNVLIRLSS